VSTLKTRFAGLAARRLRTKSTEAERKLWAHLRDRRLLGCKFVRQQPVGPYIADFACREADLVIELDGGQHAADAAHAEDTRRSLALAEHGYRVLRFWNNDVLRNIDGVCRAIEAELKAAPAPDLRRMRSTLSPAGRGDDAPLGRTQL